MRFRHFLTLHRDPNATAGGGAAAAARPRRRDASPYRDESRRSPTSLVDTLLARHGSLEAALQAVARENADLTDDLSRLTGEVDGLKARVPAEGAVVLTGDDAKAWPAFKALNLAPEKLKEQLASGETAQRQLAERTERDTQHEGAQLGGFKPSLWELRRMADVDLEIREETVERDGKSEKLRRPYVRPKGKADAALEALDAFVKREVPDLYESLKATAAGTGNGVASTGGGGPGTTGITPFAGQPAGGAGTGTAKDPLASYLADTYEFPGAQRSETQAAH